MHLKLLWKVKSTFLKSPPQAPLGFGFCTDPPLKMPKIFGRGAESVRNYCDVIISIYRQQKSQRCLGFLFNYLNLPLAKAALVLFGQKSSRFIASKSLKSCISIKLQSLQFIASKSRKKVQSLRFIASKSRKKVQSSRFIASKSREKLESSQFITNKSRKNVLFFFNHLDLPLAKVVLVLFAKKSSRFIASKSLEKM